MIVLFPWGRENPHDLSVSLSLLNFSNTAKTHIHPKRAHDGLQKDIIIETKLQENNLLRNRRVRPAISRFREVMPIPNDFRT